MIMYKYLKSYWKKTIRLLFIIVIYSHFVQNYITFLVDSLKRYLVICLKEKILIIICAYSLILLFCKQVRTVYKESNSLRYFGPIMWSLIPKEIKNRETLATFVSKIRQWRPDACPCRTFKNFIRNVGFIETN